MFQNIWKINDTVNTFSVCEITHAKLSTAAKCYTHTINLAERTAYQGLVGLHKQDLADNCHNLQTGRLAKLRQKLLAPILGSLVDLNSTEHIVCLVNILRTNYYKWMTETIEHDIGCFLNTKVQPRFSYHFQVLLPKNDLSVFANIHCATVSCPLQSNLKLA